MMKVFWSSQLSSITSLPEPVRKISTPGWRLVVLARLAVVASPAADRDQQVLRCGRSGPACRRRRPRGGCPTPADRSAGGRRRPSRPASSFPGPSSSVSFPASPKISSSPASAAELVRPVAGTRRAPAVVTPEHVGALAALQVVVPVGPEQVIVAAPLRAACPCRCRRTARRRRCRPAAGRRPSGRSSWRAPGRRAQSPCSVSLPGPPWSMSLPPRPVSLSSPSAAHEPILGAIAGEVVVRDAPDGVLGGCDVVVLTLLTVVVACRWRGSRPQACGVSHRSPCPTRRCRASRPLSRRRRGCRGQIRPAARPCCVRR